MLGRVSSERGTNLVAPLSVVCQGGISREKSPRHLPPIEYAKIALFSDIRKKSRQKVMIIRTILRHKSFFIVMMTATCVL